MATNYSRSTCNTFNIQTTHACNEACATSTTLTNASFAKCMRPTSLIKFFVNNFYGCAIWKCLFYIIVLILLAICVALQFFLFRSDAHFIMLLQDMLSAIKCLDFCLWVHDWAILVQFSTFFFCSKMHYWEHYIIFSTVYICMAIFLKWIIQWDRYINLDSPGQLWSE